MALIVVAVIIAMSLILGAEQGPKVNPTTTTYVPRPEWYFLFLFELLRTSWLTFSPRSTERGGARSYGSAECSKIPLPNVYPM